MICFRHLITISLAVTMASLIGKGQLANSANTDAFTAPPLPSNLQVPAGNTAFFKGHAIGTQNYICLPSTSGFS